MAELYSLVLGDVAGLRRGLSTGSCAQAAARAALGFLLTGEKPEAAEITLPAGNKPYSGKSVLVPVERAEMKDGTATAFVRKDAGDDRDCTGGLLIGAAVSLTNDGLVTIDGGKGVGRITRPGVAGKVGEAAINPVPRKMIRQELGRILPEGRGCRAVIFVPEGRSSAESTWNPRIGIEGGISIIGTKGVVEPKSEEAYKLSIKRVIQSYRKAGLREYIVTPGYVGEKYLASASIPMDRVVTAGDHLGYAMAEAAKRGAEKIVLAGHIGKLVKISAGIFNTHWRSGDARLEVIAACAAACGAGTALVNDILSCSLAEDAVGLINREGPPETYAMICRRIIARTEIFLQNPEHAGRDSPERPGAKIEVGCVLLSLSGEKLAFLPEDLFEWPVMRAGG